MNETPQSGGLRQTAPDNKSACVFFQPLVKRRIRIALLLALIGLFIVTALLLWLSGRKESWNEITYKNKPVAKWFCDQRKDFFNMSTRNAANEAFTALGTNAFPFLLSKLKNRGSPVWYFRLYQAAPSRLQAWLPYPLLGDDVQMITLAHFDKMRDLPPEWLAALAKQVPNLRNPRVRHHALMTVQKLAQRRQDRCLVSLCNSLLDDAHFGMRLKAAELLADADPKETRGIPILLAALEDQEKLNSSYAITGYAFRRPPGLLPTPFTGQTRFGLEQAERQMVLRALEKLRPHLDEQQRKLVRDAEHAARTNQ